MKFYDFVKFFKFGKEMEFLFYWGKSYSLKINIHSFICEPMTLKSILQAHISLFEDTDAWIQLASKHLYLVLQKVP